MASQENTLLTSLCNKLNNWYLFEFHIRLDIGALSLNEQVFLFGNGPKTNMNWTILYDTHDGTRCSKDCVWAHSRWCNYSLQRQYEWQLVGRPAVCEKLVPTVSIGSLRAVGRFAIL